MTSPVFRQEAVESHYERLRHHVLSGYIAGVRTGLGVILHKGMAVWMDVCSSYQPSSPKPAAQSHCSKINQILPDEQLAGFVELFTGMALNRIKEVYV